MVNKSNSPINFSREEWKQINWRKVEKYVFKLQKRIYDASRRGDIKRVRKLQKTLMRSWSNKVLAVRRVTQDNRGKNTPGVDGVKTLSSAGRIKLAQSLKLTGFSQPTRRVWIPKPGRDEKRPLGIPTMYDRALQGILKNALEPEWEAVFEPNSYGFRPGRCAQDAIYQIKSQIKAKAKYVLDADIAKCFDRINHLELLRKIGQKGTVRKQIKSWLTSGVVDDGTFTATSEGTPQGGVISPLLANIALHGLENMLKNYIEGVKLKYPNGRNMPKRYKRMSLGVIRYADDFVVMHESKEIVQRCRELISEWLKDIGLKLKPSKTRITHTLLKEESEDGIPGFNFLGFNIRQYRAGKSVSARNPYKKVLGFNTYIVPTKETINKHIDDCRKVIEKHKATPQITLINELNPIIRGWCNYNKVSDSQTRRIMSKADNTLYLMLRKWAKRRCKTAKKSIKYWHKHGNNNWVFSTKPESENGIRLLSHSTDFSYSVNNYVKVIGVVSPYNGDVTYWATRKGSHPEISTRVATLLSKQKGKCAQCGLTFRDEDILELDHIIPKAAGGKDIYKNLQLLHGHCHDEKSRYDLELIKEYKRVKSLDNG